MLVCLLTTSFSAVLPAAGDEKITLSYMYSFTTPCIEKTINGEQCFDSIHLDGLPETGAYGEPLLPVQEIRLLLPYRTQIHQIDVSANDPVSLGTGYIIEPAPQDIPLTTNAENQLTSHHEELYTISGVFPGSLSETIGTYGFRGYQILSLTLHPIQYDTETGELFYYPKMHLTITLNTIQTPINELYRDTTNDLQELQGKVDTIDQSTTYPSLKPQTREDYDLLIITTDELQPSFEALADYHTTQGLPTRIATLSDIGSTDPEAIRTYIRDTYLSQHIDYVLLGGDADIVPARLLWVDAGYGEIDELPADLYYSCLDGPYNYDGDDKWGEPTDGEDGGDVDLIAEVYIGRACVGDTMEVENFIQKTISYIHTDDSYLQKALMAGEFLWDAPDTWGGDYMDELINGSSAHGYTTIGVPPENYTIETLYDRDWPGHDWPKEELITRINNNIHLINHLGHSWYDYNMKMDTTDVDLLTNTRYFFAYSQGCDNGGFDNPLGYDCIAEHFTVKTDHAAFAVIANARYGFGASGSTDGANQRFHREFLDAIYGEHIIQLGRANQDSKEDNLYRINIKVTRWCYYEINLFGDPTIDFFTHYPNNHPTPTQPPSGPNTGEVGVEYTYTVSTTADPDGDYTYYKFFWGDGQSSLWLGPYNPSETVSASHVWTIAGDYNVTVKARDSYWGVSNVSEPLTVNITGPFFEIISITGGLLKANAEIQNSGLGTATNVKRSIMVQAVRTHRFYVVTNSTIDLLESGQITTAQTDKPFLGFGKIQITAAAYSPGGEKTIKTVDGYLLFFFVLVLQ